MRRAYRKMWRAVPCASKNNNMKNSPKADSKRNIEEILNDKLATIMEEPETSSTASTCGDHEESLAKTRYNYWGVLAKSKGNKKNHKKKKNNGMSKSNNNKMGSIGCLFLPHFSLKDSYALFVTGFASKGSFGGLLQY